jgi:hypothetical protein
LSDELSSGPSNNLHSKTRKAGDAMARLLVSDEEIGTIGEVLDELQHVRDVLRDQEGRMTDEELWAGYGAGRATRHIMGEGIHLAMTICRLEELITCGHRIQGASRAAARLRGLNK